MRERKARRAALERAAPNLCSRAVCLSIGSLQGDDIRYDVSDLVSGQSHARHRRMWHDDPSCEMFRGRPCPLGDSRKAWNICPHGARRRTINDVTADAKARREFTTTLRIGGTPLRKGFREDSSAQSCNT